MIRGGGGSGYHLGDLPVAKRNAWIVRGRGTDPWRSGCCTPRAAGPRSTNYVPWREQHQSVSVLCSIFLFSHAPRQPQEGFSHRESHRFSSMS